jgi:hypothetical protein
MRTYIEKELPPKLEKLKRASGPKSGDLRGCQAANLPAEAGLRLHGPVD